MIRVVTVMYESLAVCPRDFEIRIRGLIERNKTASFAIGVKYGYAERLSSQGYADLVDLCSQYGVKCSIYGGSSVSIGNIVDHIREHDWFTNPLKFPGVSEKRYLISELTKLRDNPNQAILCNADCRKLIARLEAVPDLADSQTFSVRFDLPLKEKG